MNKLVAATLCACCLLIYLTACNTSRNAVAPGGLPSGPSAMREFRAAWIATVANINWPSKPGLSTAEQQQEAVTLLNFLAAHHFNAAILQVRPQADALYKSSLEPWSYYLSGEQGKAPDPFYDPLAFWVKEAHDRGIELHVWLNPYRAHHKDGNTISDSSIVKKHPELVMQLKEGYWWMDPANKQVQDITNDVVMDIVHRYDIDGVHMDDYFYPYPSYNGTDDFPDSTSWQTYQQAGGKLSRGDWRRDAVNRLIERLHHNIRSAKPFVKFGVSPFGIWRPGYPSSIEGFDQYDQLYADARLWLNKGWVDYFAPQLYWPINKYPQSFPVLLGWWSGENHFKRHLWPGISVGGNGSDKHIDEVLNQVMIARGMLPESKGVIHWSISSLVKSPALADTILKSVYKKPALVPASPWLDNTPPAAPLATMANRGSEMYVHWSHVNEADVFRWVVYFQYGTNWQYQILNRDERSLVLGTTDGNAVSALSLTRVIVSAIDRTGNESFSKEMLMPKTLQTAAQ